MKSCFTALLFICAAMWARAQHIVHDDNAEMRNVENFSGIDASGTVAVYLAQGKNQAVAVSAGDKKYNSKIRTEVKSGILMLSVDGGLWNGFNWADKKLKAYITVTDLNSLALSGASYLTTSDVITASQLHLNISGASEMKGKLNLTALNADISGASIAKLSGTVKEAQIDASGACKLSGYDLAVDACSARATGASDIRITVNKELKAEASGGSTIIFKGDAVAKTEASAGSSIRHRKSNED